MAAGPGDGKLQVGEAEVDRDAARLLFRQAVGIGARQRLDERALAVIDVTGGGDDEMVGRRPWRCHRAGRHGADGARYVLVLPWERWSAGRA